MADDILELSEVGRKGGAPTSHYVKLSHDEWESVKSAPVFGGKLTSPTQLRDIILKIAAGQLVVRKAKVAA